MEIEHLTAICNHVRSFQARSGWEFKSLPILTFEFPTIVEFHDAKEQLFRCIMPELRGRDGRQIERLIGDDTCELDCYNVTFRLVCKQRIMLRQRSAGANDFTVEDGPGGGRTLRGKL